MSDSCTGACAIIKFFISYLSWFAQWEQAPQTVPHFVLDFAPLVWLYPTETYFPSDIGTQLVHTRPEINFTTVSGGPRPLTLSNLQDLNSLGGKNIYLSSTDNFTANPAWLGGVKPDASGDSDGAHSCAIIVNDKGNGTVDAFYMYFYAYNKGNVVLGQELGDHVGDWEHNMVRFLNGVPQALWYSQHSFGAAYTYAAVPKAPFPRQLRPLSYSANGTHANYATPGVQARPIPGEPDLPPDTLADYTNQGTLWDPTLGAYFYQVAFEGSDPTPKFTAYDGKSPTGWLSFVGQWGDEQLPKSDPSQQELAGFYKYTGGPTGPEDKQLDRSAVCPTGGVCTIQTTVKNGGY